MKESDPYPVMKKRQEIKDTMGREKRKKEYVARLEEQLLELQTQLGSERQKVEDVARKLENETQKLVPKKRHYPSKKKNATEPRKTKYESGLKAPCIRREIKISLIR